MSRLPTFLRIGLNSFRYFPLKISAPSAVACGIRGTECGYKSDCGLRWCWLVLKTWPEALSVFLTNASASSAAASSSPLYDSHRRSPRFQNVKNVRGKCATNVRARGTGRASIVFVSAFDGDEVLSLNVNSFLDFRIVSYQRSRYSRCVRRGAATGPACSVSS